MPVNERARHQLFVEVEQKLSPEAAATLMELLPPVGWADVATKRDLEQLELRMDLKMDAKLEHAIRVMTFRFIAVGTTLAGLAVAAIRLT